MLQVGNYAYDLKKNKICCGFQALEMEIKFKIKLSKVIFLIGLKSGCIQGTLMLFLMSEFIFEFSDQKVGAIALEVLWRNAFSLTKNNFQIDRYVGR